MLTDSSINYLKKSFRLCIIDLKEQSLSHPLRLQTLSVTIKKPALLSTFQALAALTFKHKVCWRFDGELHYYLIHHILTV